MVVVRPRELADHRRLGVVAGLDERQQALAVGPDAVELARQFPVRRDEVVAEQVDLLTDRAAGFVQLADGDAQLLDALFLLRLRRLAFQRGLQVGRELVDCEGLLEKVDRPATDRADRVVAWSR